VQGAAGSSGAQGPAGPGVAPGGAAGSLLAKNTGTDYDASWIATVGTTQIGNAQVTSGKLASGAAATNVGTLGGSLSGTLPNPTLAANSVGASQITDGTVGTAELAAGAVTNAKLAADTHLQQTGLEWTILGPGALTLGPPTGRIALDVPSPSEIPRADVAAVIAHVLEDESTVGRTIRFGIGDVDIAHALSSRSA
jgi:hypothetical protein